MKWEVRKINSGKSKGQWGIFLVQKFCKTKEPVCYGASKSKKSAKFLVDRMNDPDYYTE